MRYAVQVVRGGWKRDLLEDCRIREWWAVVDEKDEANDTHQKDREENPVLALLLLRILDQRRYMLFGLRRGHQLL